MPTAGVLVLESLEHAQARGATILAEYVGGEWRAPCLMRSSCCAAASTSPWRSRTGVCRVVAPHWLACTHPRADAQHASVPQCLLTTHGQPPPILTSSCMPLLCAAGAFTCDAHHMTEPQPEGKGVILCIERALEATGVAREQVRGNQLVRCVGC